MDFEQMDAKMDIETVEESEEVIYANSDIDVVIDYVWDSHGRLEECPGPDGEHREERHADSIKIIEVKRKLKIGDLPNTIDQTVWKCYINGEKVNCLDIAEYNKRKRLFIKAIVGAG